MSIEEKKAQDLKYSIARRESYISGCFEQYSKEETFKELDLEKFKDMFKAYRELESLQSEKRNFICNLI